MRTVADTELQATLSREIIEVNEKKRKLEENLRTADVRSKLLKIAPRGRISRPIRTVIGLPRLPTSQ